MILSMSSLILLCFSSQSFYILMHFLFVVSPIRAHHVAFTNEASGEEMQLYFKAGDTIRLTWIPQELIPSFLDNTNIESFEVTIQLYQQIDMQRRGAPNWQAIPNAAQNALNSGEATFTVPTGLVMKDCPDQNNLCPVAFQVSSQAPIPGGETSTVKVAIWTALAYLQADNADEASLSQICQEWAAPPPPDDMNRNRIPNSRLNQLPSCPPTQLQARFDNRFRREDMSSIMSAHNTGYERDAMKFYTPGAEVCYVLIVMGDSRFEIRML